VGSVPGGFPPIGLPSGLAWSDVAKVVGVAFSCFVLIVAQSAATSRSFAAKHNERVDVNRDLVGLFGANMAAGLSGTFVVNGSPTKTQILDEQRGRSQVANATMSAVTLVILLVATKALAPMPNAVLAAIVFVIGIDLVDVAGLRRIAARRRSELVIALVTAVVVFAVGVEQGIILAVVLSILEIIRRQYTPKSFVVSLAPDGEPVYTPAKPGLQSAPGLIVFRYDADLFFANANRFVDDVKGLVLGAPVPVRWLVVDAGALDDVDYSAGVALGQLQDFLVAREVTLALARADTGLLDTLRRYGLLERVAEEHLFGNLVDAVDAFLALRRTLGGPPGAGSPGPGPDGPARSGPTGS
jgi:MFS superfamily sulfate permease-like transporter